MELRIYQYFLFTAITLLSAFNDNLYINATTSFWVMIIIISLEFFKVRGVNLIMVFLIAFVYMIPVEGMLQHNLLYAKWGLEVSNFSFFLLQTTAMILFVGYSIINVRKYNEQKHDLPELFNSEKIKKLRLFILIYNIFYMIFHFKMIIENMMFGRGSGDETLNVQLTALALITIPILVRIEKNKLVMFLFMLPSLIVLVGTGTRLYLVYAIFMIATSFLFRMNVKSIFRTAIYIIPILFAMNAMKDLRTTGISQMDSFTVDQKKEYNNFNQKIASLGSSEGLIRNVSMITDYINKNDYTYGASIGFITYWWVPRTIWPDKPVMLDYWLIREYETGFSQGHSTASSYMGEIYMDFGAFSTIVFFLFAGMLLAKLQSWINLSFNSNFLTIVIGSFLYGWVFFATRSILTATYMLTWVLVFSFFIYYLLKKHNYLNALTR